MSSSALRIIAILLAVGAAVMGYLGYQASQQTDKDEAVSTEMASEPRPEPRYTIVVAADDLTVGDTIEADDLSTVETRREYTSSFDDIQRLIGREIKIPLKAGDMLLADHFHKPSDLVRNIRAGERAVAVRVDEVTGTGGFIQPGDRVDVLLYLQSGQETGDDSSAQRLLSDVRVLAYGDDVEKTNIELVQEQARAYRHEDTKASGLADQLRDDTPDDADHDEDEEVSGKKSKTAVLAIAEADTPKLLLAESSGRLRLSLLGGEERPDVATNDSTVEDSDNHFVLLKSFNSEGLNDSVPKRRSSVPATPPPTPRKQVIINRGAEESSITLQRER